MATCGPRSDPPSPSQLPSDHDRHQRNRRNRVRDRVHPGPGIRKVPSALRRSLRRVVLERAGARVARQLEKGLPAFDHHGPLPHALLQPARRAPNRGGTRQVVLLGGGFDMRAHHYRDAGATFFEVDQKAVLEFKRTVLAQTGSSSRRRSSPTTWRRTCRRSGRHRLRSRRAHADDLGGQHDVPAPESIMPFLNRLADAMSSFRIAFDYFPVDMQNRDELERDKDRERLEGVEKAMGASFPTGFRTSRCSRGRRRSAWPSRGRSRGWRRGMGWVRWSRVSGGLAGDAEAVPVLRVGEEVGAPTRQTVPRAADTFSYHRNCTRAPPPPPPRRGEKPQPVGRQCAWSDTAVAPLTPPR